MAHVRARSDEVGDRVAGEHGEEGVKRLAQRRIQRAAVDQRAFGGVVLEAFGHGEAFFSDAHDIEQVDLLGRAAESYAAVAATHGLDQAGLDQRLQNLEQEQLRNRIGGGDLRDTAQPVGVRGAIHQYAHRIIGLAREPHGSPRENISLSRIWPIVWNNSRLDRHIAE